MRFALCNVPILRSANSNANARATWQGLFGPKATMFFFKVLLTTEHAQPDAPLPAGQSRTASTASNMRYPEVGIESRFSSSIFSIGQLRALAGMPRSQMCASMSFAGAFQLGSVFSYYAF